MGLPSNNGLSNGRVEYMYEKPAIVVNPFVRNEAWGSLSFQVRVLILTKKILYYNEDCTNRAIPHRSITDPRWRGGFSLWFGH